MPLSEAAASLLRAVLAERDGLVERATDKVFFESPDLMGKRSRLVTRMLVDRVFGCAEAALLRGDESEIDVFIDQVTGIRAESDFHVSTLLTGFRSFRFGIEEAVPRHAAADPWAAWELINAADKMYARSAARAADLLVERQHAALVSRRGYIERENARLSAELRLLGESMGSLRAELDAGTMKVLSLEQEVREKNAIIHALTEGDRQARQILDSVPPGPERIEALRGLRRDSERAAPPEE